MAIMLVCVFPLFKKGIREHSDIANRERKSERKKEWERDNVKLVLGENNSQHTESSLEQW